MEQFFGSVFFIVHLAMSYCKLNPVMLKLAVGDLLIIKMQKTKKNLMGQIKCHYCYIFTCLSLVGLLAEGNMKIKSAA